MINDLTQFSSVPVLAESFLPDQKPKADDSGTCRVYAAANGEARESTKEGSVRKDISRFDSADSRGGRKYLPASVRSQRRELVSRVRILRKALTRTDNLDSFHLYWKAILCAEFDIQELTI